MKEVRSFLKNLKILKVLILAIIFVIPLLPKFPLFQIPETSVAIRFEDFLIAVSAVIWFFYFRPRKKEFFKDNLNLAILLYLFVGVVSLLSSIFITQTVSPHLGLFHYLRRIEYFLPFFIAQQALTTRREVMIALSFLFIATIGVFFYGIGQIYFGLPVISTTNVEYAKGLMLPLTEGARVNSTFAGHYDLAAYLAIVLCLSSAVLFGLLWTRKQFFKTGIFVLVFSLFSYWLLITTESRISFLAFVLGLIVVLYLSKKKALIFPVLVLVFLGLLISPNLAKRFSFTFSQGIEFFQKKIENQQTYFPAVFAQVSKPSLIHQSPIPTAAGSVQEVVTAKTEKPAPGEPEDLLERIVYRSGGIRFDVEWPRAIRAFLKNPILGTGYSSITLATDNDYLRALGETGILGFLSFFLIFLEFSRRVIVFLKRKTEGWSKAVVVGMTGVIIAMVINALFIDVFEASKVAIIFWLLMGILVATIRISKTENV
ncbi:hypothetical protein A2Z23_01635 [Candidatus Curtissbacteria bacterium RBG_16_39_7]|uniref:O-antigen ligase-related domain-containing protein n=1 Tax=Candidatus Curtissbacteria bacterium RBG_16_39_7 TaxID=1797707 RepID=A0A1F5G558_9BACT|nr:MAG: hypothetical protein A2Z23_01635 [Candidatus Curtissbacteria bacterium RBG_16_39_7]